MTSTLDKIVLNKKNTHSLAYDLFESSYNKKLLQKIKRIHFIKLLTTYIK